MISKATLTKLDPIVRKVSGGRLYTSYEIGEEEYVGKVVLPETYEIKPYLKRNGYEEIWFEAVKTHPETKQTHDLAMRKTHGMMDRTPEEARRTGLLDGYHYKQRQWHVHGFRRDGYMHLYSHYELRGDPWPIANESLLDAISRAREHYKPTWDTESNDRENWTYLRGVMDPALEGLLG